MFENYFGNPAVAATLERMLETGRIAQTILLAGPEGVGKATLARRAASRLLGSAEKIEQDDLSREQNRALLAEREKWPGDKRAADPLLFATHPDFVTFCPEGPLRQLSIQQMRLLKARARLRPLKGHWRVFLIGQIDRAGPQAADSLLKTLEEPPSHLVLFLTAGNPFDLPPTIRSRAVQFRLSPLSEEDMRKFCAARRLPDAERRIALAGGCPGLAATLDLELHEKRRAVMLSLLESAAGQAPFAEWVKNSEAFLASKSEKLDAYLGPAYSLLEDLVAIRAGGTRIRNPDLEPALRRLAARTGFGWLRAAVGKLGEMAALQRRNVQKTLIFDDFVVTLRTET
jgi:DNA polymerase-3 subunit delta'